MVGKYVELTESYKSLSEALITPASTPHARSTSAIWIPRVSSATAPACWRARTAILVPGGFGERGVEGKIAAVRYARENKVPYLGICLGMQVAVIEFARNVAGLEGAHSTEFSEARRAPGHRADHRVEPRGRRP